MRHLFSKLTVAVLASSLTGCGNPTPATTAGSDVSGKVVTDWVAIVEPSIHNAREPRGPASSIVLHNIAHLAVYDAVVAIEGGFRPYHRALDAPDGADVRAAVATAAYRAVRGRAAASQLAYLDERYSAYLAGIPEGESKTDGIAVGEQAAASVLEARAGDGFNTRSPTSAAPTLLLQASSSPTADAAPCRSS